MNRTIWQCWAVFIGNYRLPQKKFIKSAKRSYKFAGNPCRKQAYTLVEASEILAESKTDLWRLISNRGLPSSCNECGQGNFNFIGLERAVAVEVVAD